MTQGDYRICIELPSSHRFLNVAGLTIDAVLHRLGDLLPGAEDVSREVQVATQEICANVVDHAYEADSDGRLKIEIVIELNESKLDVHIRDSGKEFDENIVQQPELGSLQERGFGLYFAKKLMDNVIYSRENNENHWHLIKHLGIDKDHQLNPNLKSEQLAI
ncbi:MAG: ATP-binding protein [Anaerolineae bacterium]